MLTDERLAEIRERESKATKGPWVQWVEHAEVYRGPVKENEPGHISGYRGKVCSCPDSFDLEDDDEFGEEDSHADADFIAHAREDIPDLLAEIDRLRALVAHIHLWEANGGTQ